MKYLYYKTKKKMKAGISDRRACIAVLLAEAKLTNRIAILPKMILSKYHETLGNKDIIDYIHDKYFKITNIEYTTDTEFKINDINPEDVLNINERERFDESNKMLVIRNCINDNYWRLGNLHNVIKLAGIYHGTGMNLSNPIFYVPDNIKKIGDSILSRLKKPTIGIHLRMRDRMNESLKKKNYFM